jgi:hypothetical protein
VLGSRHRNRNLRHFALLAAPGRKPSDDENGIAAIQRRRRAGPTIDPWMKRMPVNWEPSRING